MKKTTIALFLFALLGLAASLMMTHLHYKMGVGLDENSFCHVSDFFDCDTALASSYARIGRFLNSELGVIYYVLVILGLIYAGASQENQATLTFLFASSFFAVLYSFLMAYFSIFKLGVLCLLCSTDYLVSILLFVLFPKALRIRYRDIPKFFVDYIKSVFGEGSFKPRLLFHLGITVLVLGGGLLAFQGFNPQIHKPRPRIPAAAYLKSFYDQPQKSIDVGHGPYWGNQEAKVTIVEFSDFQCPFCRRAAFNLKPYLKPYKDHLRFFFFNYPLDNTCNPALQHAMHPTACLAAKAALCAFHQGKFWEYHDKVFENQKKLSRETLLRLAGELGMERSSFEQCMISEETAKALQQDVEIGNQLDIHGTPSIFINGRIFQDWPSPERLRLVIDAEIGASTH